MVGWTAPRHRVPELGCQKPTPKPSLSHITRIGIDTSKAVFALHCVDDTGRAVLRTNLRRAQLVTFFRKLPPAEIAMEACGSSHHWVRELSALGHTVPLIPPQYGKPFVKRAKNDRNDAEAICEAAGPLPRVPGRPGMRFVPVKSAEQQPSLACSVGHGMVLKVGETLIGQRTQLINTLRGHAAEFGVIAGKGISCIAPLLKAIEAETAIPLAAREMLALLGREIEHLNAKPAEFEVRLTAMHKTNPLSQRLATSAADAFRHIGSLRDPIPGVGVIIALTLAIEIDPVAFKSGRYLAAWIGLTPKEHSTAGKQRMGDRAREGGGISRAGNERLRQLLVTGASAVIRFADRPGNKQANEWLVKLLQRRPRKLAAVALAKKMARVAWAKLAKVPTDQLRPVGMTAEGMMMRGREAGFNRPPPEPRVDARVSRVEEGRGIACATRFPPRNKRFKVSRTSSHRPMLPGVTISPTLSFGR